MNHQQGPFDTSLFGSSGQADSVLPPDARPEPEHVRLLAGTKEMKWEVIGSRDCRLEIDGDIRLVKKEYFDNQLLREAMTEKLSSAQGKKMMVDRSGADGGQLPAAVPRQGTGASGGQGGPAASRQFGQRPLVSPVAGWPGSSGPHGSGSKERGQLSAFFHVARVVRPLVVGR